MKILITGATGMLGQALISVLGNEFEIYTTSSGNRKISTKNYVEFDLRSDDYTALIKEVRPGLIIHCAAITNVNLCESNPSLADKVNADSVKNLLSVVDKNTRIIYISSDAVFGNVHPPFGINDAKEPISYYGKSKLNGEEYLTGLLDKHTIIRTTIVGQNPLELNYGLVAWCLNAIQSSEITAYKDSIFTPITSWQLSNEIKYIIKSNLTGVWHITGSEACSKYDFLKELVLSFDSSKIGRVTAGELKQVKNAGKRVLNQSLSVELYENKTNRKLPNLKKVIESIKLNYKE